MGEASPEASPSKDGAQIENNTNSKKVEADSNKAEKMPPNNDVVNTATNENAEIVDNPDKVTFTSGDTKVSEIKANF